MAGALRSIEDVCVVTAVRGAEARADAVPDLLLEVPHAATRAHHFERLRAQLRGHYDDGLRDFFFVNTDVGAPELAHAIAAGYVATAPQRSAVVLTSEIPRTLIDCNRSIDAAAVGASSKAGELTPGLPPWVVDEHDRQVLLERYFAYRGVATAGFEAVCGNGGRALCVHSYAPRSLQVDVDEDIAKSLRAAYAPDRINTWPLRPEVDLITHDGDGREWADAELAARAERSYADAGFDVARNGTYHLHPSTLAYEFAVRFPGTTLCFEVRRDLLVPEFVPFVELLPDPAKVERAAAPVIAALSGGGS